MIDPHVTLNVAQSLALKIMPLYGFMGLGYLFGKVRPQSAEPLAALQVYVIAPLLILALMADMQFQQRYLLLPFVVYAICVIVGFATLWLGRKIWTDNTVNIFAFACGGANAGYFGLPVALAVLSPEMVAVFMLTSLGFMLFEFTFGYVFIARGKHTMADSIKKLLRLPPLYAMIVGVLLSVLNIHVPALLQDSVRDMRGCYVVIGAMLIGLGLARLHKIHFDLQLKLFVNFMKFGLWPMLALGVIALDVYYFHCFGVEIHKIILLLAIMPIPVNTLVYAIQLDVQPDKASTMVFVTTLIALFYVPLVVGLWG
ncbi:MAG: AEC family transporter [Alphaproteobacteria bacterium]|nr:AEC family transporter [Alphaproteobacteria bacterium]MBV8548696.1 AEC family transporter [Alphaproteobacteria bacterium]